MTGIGSKNIDEAFSLVAAVISHENEMQLLNRSPRYLIIPEVLEHFGIIENISTVPFIFETHGTVPIPTAPLSARFTWTALSDSLTCQTPLYLRFPEKYYWFSFLENSRTMYVHYSNCAEMKNEPFVEFSKRVFLAVDSLKAENFVFDLRNNGGGSSVIARPLIDGVIARPSINQKGKFFVIIGRETYSSALINAMECKNETNAIFVGEATGGKPNCYGELRFFMLPNSPISITYSTKYFKYSTEDIPYLLPDLPVPISFSDFTNCFDPVLDQILQRIQKRNL